MRKTTPKRAKPPTDTEAAIQSAILTAFELRRIRAWRVNSGSIFVPYTTKSAPGRKKTRVIHGAPKGTPDLQVHVAGPVWAFGEIKRPGGSLNPDQVAWHAWAEREGVLVAVWHSVEEALFSVAKWRCDVALRW